MKASTPVVSLPYLRPMAYPRIYARHALLIEFVRHAKQPTVRDMLRHLEEQGERVDVRSIQRDIKQISEEMDIEIKKQGSHPRHWYAIESEPEERPVASTYLEYAMMTDIMRKEVAEEKKHGKVIFLDFPVMTSGLNNIPLLLPAIRAKKMVRMTYRKFSGEESVRELCPLYFKQYRKRWYLLARDTGDDQVKSFGLERIVSVDQLTKKFKLREGEDHDSIYANAIGLFDCDSDPVTIRFWSEAYNANYVRSVPLHPSQQEVERADTHSVFELYVVPNFEFYQSILMMGDKARIVSPDNVKKEMKRVISDMLKFYK
jgi:predicted DNA-binding transcriptional regulator YafY